MGNSSSDYRKAYETARRELKELVDTQERLEKKKISLRKTIETLGALCESEGIEIEPSREATHLIEQTSFADEIRAILKAQYPAWLRPNRVKEELARMGVHMSHYQNPQATIQTILSRMAVADEVREETMPEDGKKAYRWKAAEVRPPANPLAGHPAARYGQGPPPMPKMQQQAPPPMPPMYEKKGKK